MKRHRTFLLACVVTLVAGCTSWWLTRSWEGWEQIGRMVSAGDNLPIAGLISLVIFFTYLSLADAFRHDRLIQDGRASEIRDEMWK